MRGNRVKEKLQAGKIATVIGGHSNSTHTIDFMGSLGFDGFWIEGEHGTVTWDQIDDLARVCDLWGIASVMRVHSSEPWTIYRTLDRGVNGIVIPHVNTKEQAEQVVQAARFGPIGKRGIYPSRRSYGHANYYEHANDEILVVVLIEEVDAVRNLSEILKVEGIDVFFVAPGDLSQSMGYPGQMDHPQVVEAVNGAIRQIVNAGRVAGALGFDHTIERYVNLGARFFLNTYDDWLRNAARDYLKRMDEVAAKAGRPGV